MSLDPLSIFGPELARTFGGTAISLEAGEWQSSAIRIGAHCRLLIRDHHGSFTVSLPVADSWHVRGRADWEQAAPEVARALAAHAPIVSMSDVIARVFGGWNLEFPGTSVPGEAWVKRGPGSVGLFQTPTSVRIFVWEEHTPHEREVSTLDALGAVPAWLEEKLPLQARAAEVAEVEAAAEKVRRSTTPAPAFDEVMAAISAGQEFQIGGGRYYTTYKRKDGRLLEIVFDEGETMQGPCTENEIRAAILASPYEFHCILERSGLRR